MIVRPWGSAWLILHQRDHAVLSADLAQAMPLPPFDGLRSRETLLEAIAHHDDGWIAWDAVPIIDPRLGRPRGFDEMERRDSLPIWRESIERAARYGQLAGATVAAHFLALCGSGRNDAFTESWANWAKERHQEWLDTWFAENPAHDRTLADMALGWLQFFDAFSLNLCRGNSDQSFTLRRPDGDEVFLIWVNDATVRVEPWFFRGSSLSLSMKGYHFPSVQPDRREIIWELIPATT